MSKETANKPHRRLTRAVGGAVGLSTIFAIAGCTGDDDSDVKEPQETDDTGADPTHSDGGDSDEPHPEPENGADDRIDDADPEPEIGADDGNDDADPEFENEADDGIDDADSEPENEEEDDEIDDSDSEAENGEDDSDSDDTCTQDRIADLETRRDTLRWNLEDLRAEFENELTSYWVMQTFKDQWTTGFDESVIDQTRSLGEKVRDAICVVKQMDGDSRLAHGTGWFIEKDIIITNSHNVHQDGQLADLRITTIDGTDIEEVTVLGFDEWDSPDVAVIQTTGYNHDTTLSTGSLDTLEEDDVLIQVGHPGRVGYWVEAIGRFVTTESAFWESPDGEFVEFSDLVATVPVEGGVSGSPLFNLNGEVVGMTWGGDSVFERSAGEPAPVAPTRVFDTYLSQIGPSLHVGIDIVHRLREEWE